MIPKMRMVLLGNRENRRVELFSRAFFHKGGCELRVVDWLDYLVDRTALSRYLTPGCLLRIESPGENFEVERSLLAIGSKEGIEPQYRKLTREEVRALKFERGRIQPLRQWFLGWRRALADLQAQIDTVPNCRVMNSPAEIVAMFDKARCHELLGSLALPVPALLGLPASFDELQGLMRDTGCHRIFIKPCHSSSASGVVALEIGRFRMQAFSSVECVRVGRELSLFNSLKVRRYTSPAEIAELVDAVCQERSIAEAWFPKAGFDGERFDLRVLIVAGRSAHTVMRQSPGPITNLHLGNRRGDLDQLMKRMGPKSWSNAMAICEQAASAFPKCLYVAVDLLVAPSFNRFAIAEVNAFGDLLPNLHFNGMDTYKAELNAWKAFHYDSVSLPLRVARQGDF